MPSHHSHAPLPRLSRLALAPLAALALLTLPGGCANAQATDHGAHHHIGAPTESSTSAQELSEGEVMRWDARSAKLTLRHGELKNLAMPPMTMVFTLREPSQAAPLKPGDKVRFRVERVQGVFVITHIEPAH